MTRKRMKKTIDIYYIILSLTYTYVREISLCFSRFWILISGHLVRNAVTHSVNDIDVSSSPMRCRLRNEVYFDRRDF